MRHGGVDPGELVTWQRAQAAVDKTRRDLRWGRGNVQLDVVRTGRVSTERVSASRDELTRLRLPQTRPLDHTADLAAQAQFMAAGNCAEHAALTAVHLAGHLQGEEQIDIVNSEMADHVWAEWARPAADDQMERWVLDAWAEGPALHFDDARQQSVEDPEVEHTVRPEDAAGLLGRFDLKRTQLRANTTPEDALLQARTRLQGAGVQFGPAPFDRPVILRPEIVRDLAAQVRSDRSTPLPGSAGDDGTAFSPANHPLRRVLPELAAQGVARALGADVRTATAQAPSIVAAGLREEPVDRLPAESASIGLQRSTLALMYQQYVAAGRGPRRDPTRPDDAD